MAPSIPTDVFHSRLQSFAEARLPRDGSVEVTRETLARWVQTRESQLYGICESYNQTGDARFSFCPAPSVAGVPFIKVQRRTL